MSILDLSDTDFRRALRQMSVPDDVDHPILHSPLLDAHLRREELPDHLRHRWWVLSQVVCETVAERVATLRGEPATSAWVEQLPRPASAAVPQLFDALCLNGHDDLRAWTSLWCRYCLDLEPHERLHEVLGVHRRSLQRWLRLGLGLLRRRLHEADLELAADEPEAVAASAQRAGARTLDPGSKAASDPSAGDWLGTDPCFVAPRLVLSHAVDMMPALDRQRFGSISQLLAAIPRGPLVVLGAPGAGKTTLLQQFEQEAELPPRSRGCVPVFRVPLRSYPAVSGAAPPDPWLWLVDVWSRHNPEMPSLPSVWAAGHLNLLLDGLSELPHTTGREYWELARLWKRLVWELTARRSASRVVLTCRTADFHVPFELPGVPVTVARIEPWDEVRIQRYLELHAVPDVDRLWHCLHHHGLLGLARTPDRLRQLVEWWRGRHAAASDPDDLLLAWIQGALQREVLADNPLFAPGPLLSEDDLRREVHASWHHCRHALPEGGILMPSLCCLARAMPASAGRSRSGAAWAWRHEALAVLAQAPELSDAIVRAGLALGVLEESKSGDRLAFADPTLQDFFARRN